MTYIKVNNNDIRKTSIDFTNCSMISIVDFKQINAGSVIRLIISNQGLEIG